LRTIPDFSYPDLKQKQKVIYSLRATPEVAVARAMRLTKKGLGNEERRHQRITRLSTLNAPAMAIATP